MHAWSDAGERPAVSARVNRRSRPRTIAERQAPAVVSVVSAPRHLITGHVCPSPHTTAPPLSLCSVHFLSVGRIMSNPADSARRAYLTEHGVETAITAATTKVSLTAQIAAPPASRAA